MRLPNTPATAVLRAVRDLVRRASPAGRVVVAVDGWDGSGRAMFADALAEAFAEDGGSVFRASMDGFQRSRADRAGGSTDPAERYYRDTYDLSALRRVLLDPFRTGVGAGFQLAVYDPGRDAPVESQWVTAPRDAVLLVDGPFLLRPELRSAWDASVWLDVPVRIAFLRLSIEGRAEAEPDAPANAWRRGGFERYVRDASPRRSASIVVDHADLARPIILTEGAL